MISALFLAEGLAQLGCGIGAGIQSIRKMLALLIGMLTILAVALEPSEPLQALSLYGACAAS